MPKKHRINFDFPKEEFGYLKLLCHTKEMTIKDYLTKLITENIEAEEDMLLAKQVEETIESSLENDYIPWEEAVKLAGWDV